MRVRADGSARAVTTKLDNNPHVLHQGWNWGQPIPESDIAACTTNDGMIVLCQEGRHLLINQDSVNELCRLLKKLRDAGRAA